MEIEIKVKGDFYEDKEEINRFLNSSEIYSLLFNVKELIRSRIKHSETIGDDEFDFLEQLQDVLMVEQD